MFSNLEWLPPPPEDFRSQIAGLKAEVRNGVGAEFAGRLLSLATTALDETQLNRLAAVSRQIRSSDLRIDGFSTAKVGLVGDGTLSLCAMPILGSGLRHGLCLEVIEGRYNSAVQEAVDENSVIRTAGLDFVLVAGDARMLGLDQAAVSHEQAEGNVSSAFARLKMIVDGLRPSIASAIIVQTLPPPVEWLFGSFDRLHPGSPFAMVEALNSRIVDWAAAGGIVLLDIARLATTVGLEAWHDPGHWHASKLPFSPRMTPLYAEIVARTIAAIRGRTRKCLVLDLDNTLWGGVIGDDGLAGIRIGQGSASAEAFIAIQQMALDLRGRGVVLAVCSKNEEDAARLPFREHPDMLLREQHIAVFQANWTEKAANLRVIAETLNIGVDALVLLDDNPAERLQVRRALPQVGVPELPDDPALFPRALMAAGYFETVTFSAEDRARADMYQANALRTQALSESGDLEAYLTSLNMVCIISLVDSVSRARVSQLINKSNQFNLTTRRYSEAEVESAAHDPTRHVVQVRLADRFGDNGIISVVIADKGTEDWEIDTWLMSCRVLGRRVQEAVLAHLAAAAAAHGARSLTGRYIPSAKNRMVSGHYQSLGFEPAREPADGETLWRLDLAAYRPPQLPMVVKDSALAIPQAAP